MSRGELVSEVTSRYGDTREPLGVVRSIGYFVCDYQLAREEIVDGDNVVTRVWPAPDTPHGIFLAAPAAGDLPRPLMRGEYSQRSTR